MRVGNGCVLHRPTLRPARFNLLLISGLIPKTCRVQANFVKTVFVGREEGSSKLFFGLSNDNG